MQKTQFPSIGIMLIQVLMLIFLNACSEEETFMGSGEMQIHVVGTITYQENGSPAENVEVQLLEMTFSILKTTVTDQDGKYSINYYGKCSILSANTTLFVAPRPPAGYTSDWRPYNYLQCISDTQTFNFQLILKP